MTDSRDGVNLTLTLDPETGLYYYGYRYLDPQLCKWTSTDRALIRYLPKSGGKNSKLPGLGGVYNSINLNMYVYAGNNPVYYTDPDGDEISVTTITLIMIGGFTLIDLLDNCYTVHNRLGDKADSADYMTAITMSMITGPQSFASTMMPIVGKYTIGAENAALKEIIMQKLEQRHDLRGNELDLKEVAIKSGIDIGFKVATQRFKPEGLEILGKKSAETIGKNTINQIRSALSDMRPNREKQNMKNQKLQPGFSAFGQSFFRSSR